MEEKKHIEKSDATVVSIIIPLYNCQDFIQECLDSIFAQTLTSDSYQQVKLELSIYEDGSTDNTLKIVEESFQKLKNDTTNGDKFSLVISKNESASPHGGNYSNLHISIIYIYSNRFCKYVYLIN